MKTTIIEIQTKTNFSDPVKAITRVPRPIVTMAKDFQSGHLIPHFF
jgi:hypothetical protein